MNPGEHEIMARVEADHWWYRGLRHVLARSLAGLTPALPAAPRVLDAGCGTGENLRFLSSLLAPSYLGGFDASDEALHYAQQKAPAAELYVSDICAPEVHASELDLIVSMDVIYIPGADRVRDGLRKLIEHLKPGGIFIINVPALSWLQSEHDLAVHTHQRFTVRELSNLMTELGLSVEVATYRLFWLFPVMVLSRLPSMWRARFRPDPDARSELHDPPSRLVNTLLTRVMRFEGSMIGRGARLPIGGSAYLIGRKPPA
jgi:SAM-dependent methyltransferase